MMVMRDDPSVCSKCGSSHIHQETDVLDTWFSSWLWPFSTLGWPDKTPDLATFFPTSTLITAYDIIFFWVSRMIMASLEFMGEVPFKDIYITGLVRDRQGRKMSKSLGNGIDPLDVVDMYGADAMKFTLCYLAAQGQDVLIDMDSFKMGSRFANKIWNAARFLLMNLEGRELVDVSGIELQTMDRWIYHELNEAAAKVEAAMSNYRFNDAAQAVYDFFWNDFCDWYVEAVKHSLYSEDTDEKDRAVSLLLDLLAESMRLMHPFLSFITEEIYAKLPNVHDQLIVSRYPRWEEGRSFPAEAAIVGAMQSAVRVVRNLRGELQIGPEKKLHVVIRPDAGFIATAFFEERKDLLAGFINAGELVIDATHETDISGAVPVAGSGFECFVFIKEAIDINHEIQRLEADLAKAEQSLAGVMAKLSNEKFVANAKPEAVEKERAKQAEFEEKLEKGAKHLEVLRSFL